MNKRRLLKLADLLEADAKKATGIKFDLADWGHVGDNKKPVSCGTSACAMGLAVASGAFKREGLRSYWDNGNINNLCPMHEGNTGFDAAVSLFKISHRESWFLFSDDNYPRGKTKRATGERYVAKRIRDFVAGKAKPSDA